MGVNWVEKIVVIEKNQQILTKKQSEKFENAKRRYFLTKDIKIKDQDLILGYYQKVMQKKYGKQLKNAL